MVLSRSSVDYERNFEKLFIRILLYIFSCLLKLVDGNFFYFFLYFFFLFFQRCIVWELNELLISCKITCYLLDFSDFLFVGKHIRQFVFGGISKGGQFEITKKALSREIFMASGFIVAQNMLPIPKPTPKLINVNN